MISDQLSRDIKFLETKKSSFGDMMDLLYDLTMVYLDDCPSASVNWTRNIKSVKTQYGRRLKS